MKVKFSSVSVCHEEDLSQVPSVGDAIVLPDLFGDRDTVSGIVTSRTWFLNAPIIYVEVKFLEVQK